MNWIEAGKQNFIATVSHDLNEHTYLFNKMSASYLDISWGSMNKEQQEYYPASKDLSERC